MKLELVGGSYNTRSVPFDHQRCINLIPYPSESKNSREPSALVGTAGKTLFATCGDGHVSGAFRSGNGRAFVVSGSFLYELYSDGTKATRGSLLASPQNVTIAENGLELAVCDGTYLYILTYSTDVFAQVVDADLPSPAKTVCFLGGYFIVNKGSTGEFYISGLYSGSTWSSLDFATAEQQPDPLVRVFSVGGNLVLFGELTTEIWYNSGDSDFPFALVSGGLIETGCASAFTVRELDNSAFWLGQDKHGGNIVYRTQGYTPKRISTSAIEYKLAQYPDKSQFRAYTYQEDGHSFYVLTGGGMDTALVYDAFTELWHERTYLNGQGEYEQDLASCHMFAFGKHLIGDRRNGNIYETSLSVYTDNGAEIKRERIFPHIAQENERFSVNELNVLFESGVGLQSGQGSDPQAVLKYSIDGGRTWTSEYNSSIGAVGAYRARAVWRSLGNSEAFTFSVSVTDPVKVVMMGAYAK